MQPCCFSEYCGFPWLTLSGFNSKAVFETEINSTAGWKRPNNSVTGRLNHELYSSEVHRKQTLSVSVFMEFIDVIW